MIDFSRVADRAKRLPTSLTHRWLLRRHRTPATLAAAGFEARRRGYKRIGVDIFDTVLVRRLLTDQAIEHAVAHRAVGEGLWPGSVDEFLESRDAAQAALPSASLRDWLASAPMSLLTDPDRVYDVALEVEEVSAVAVPGAPATLADLRASGTIDFVSDMHFAAPDLRQLLCGLDLVRDGDRVLSSCDLGTSKSEGGLYAEVRHVGDGVDAQPSAAFIGNHPWADLTQAHRSGLDPIPAQVGNPSRYEAAMASSPSSMGTAIAGSARLQRLELRDGEDLVRTVSGQVIGQTMAAFLFWVREECRRSGVKRIEFLARDGELPLRMAEAMDPQIWAEHDLHYLHCGRKAWSLAAAPLVGVAEWIAVGTQDPGSFLLHSSTTAPFRRVLERCGLVLSDLPEDCELAGLDCQLPLDPTQTEAWKSLLRSGRLDEAILAAAAPNTELVVAFLRQSGIDKERTAFVDVGWRGQQAWLISAIVKEATGVDPIHLHFGGDQVLQFREDAVDIRRFAFDDSVIEHPISSPVACLEMFLASGEARLTGYRRETSGEVVEVFEDSPSAVKNRSRTLILEGAVDLARRLPTAAEMDWWGLTDDALDQEVRALLTMFWNEPTTVEAEVLAGLRFESDDSGAVVGAVVRPYAAGEIIGRDVVPRVWRQASLRLTPRWFRPAMVSYFWLRQAATAIRRP